MNHTDRVTIYTDGGADPNPGPGGWGVILIHEATQSIRELSGRNPNTTNNRMELTAAIEALAALKRPCAVTLYTDSEYLRRGITEWMPGWAARGWKRKGGQIQNVDLWRRLSEQAERHEVDWQWVKGHAGIDYNERADQLATAEIRRHYAGQSGQASSEAEVYLAVSCRNGEGWWGALVHHQDQEQFIHGYEVETSANRLDILAACEALNSLPDGISVQVYSLSDYLRNGASKWIKGWRSRDWRKKDGEQVKHAELWQALDGEIRARRVKWPSTKDQEIFEFEELGERLREVVEEQMHQDDDGYFYDA